jgi:hypothetical protein
MKKYLAFSLTFFVLLWVLPAGATAARGKVRSEEAVVYKSANFDSPVIAKLPAGGVYYISSVLFNGAFYRIMVKRNLIGYVADYQIDPLSGATAAAPKVNTERKKTKPSKNKEKAEARKEPPQRPLSLTRYGGFEYASIDYKEHTMGGNYHEGLSFFGAKFSGPDLLVSGPFTMDINLLMHFGAPGYYKTATGNSADGFVFLADVMFESTVPMTAKTMIFYGFGPMFHFSKFNLQLGTAPSKKNYVAEDMNLGAVFNLGGALRLNRRWGLRGEARYYWEKATYIGFTGAVQYAF